MRVRGCEEVRSVLRSLVWSLGVLRPPLSLLPSGGKCVICQTDMINENVMIDSVDSYDTNVSNQRTYPVIKSEQSSRVQSPVGAKHLVSTGHI